MGNYRTGNIVRTILLSNTRIMAKGKDVRVRQSTGKGSKAQRAHRAQYGQTCSIVNRLMANAEQKALLEQQMKEHNRQQRSLPPAQQRMFKTTRQYAYYKLSEQLKQQGAEAAKQRTTEITLPRGVKALVKPFAELEAAEIYEILKARAAVFTLEQGIRYLDADDTDYTAMHFALRRHGQVIAYARLFADGEPGTMRIGRMLTVERGKGFARYLMQLIVDHARKQGVTTLRLHAQQQVIAFYRHLGFHAAAPAPTKEQPNPKAGQLFEEAGILHLLMERRLTRPRKA